MKATWEMIIMILSVSGCINQISISDIPLDLGRSVVNSSTSNTTNGIVSNLSDTISETAFLQCFYVPVLPEKIPLLVYHGQEYFRNFTNAAYISNISGTYINSCTTSMEPTITCSDTLIVVPASNYDIQVGNIILFHTTQLNIIHRVVDIRQDSRGIYYITKGDNNPTVDCINTTRKDQIGWKVVGKWIRD